MLRRWHQVPAGFDARRQDVRAGSIMRKASLMQLLLGSGGFRTPERVSLLCEHMKSHFGDIERILFIPYALADHDGYVAMLNERGLNADYVLDGIHRHHDPKTAVLEADAIYVGGGNTFRLLSDLYRNGLIEPIRQRVRDGMPYMGVSAGTNVACPTMMTTNDMPITMPPSFDALNLVPFQINAHYFNGQSYVKRDDGYHEHFGETRDDRIREFHEMNDTPVLGLWEGGVLRIDDHHVALRGSDARIFRQGQEPKDVSAGASLDELLVTG
jgi:dipeptidase E